MSDVLLAMAATTPMVVPDEFLRMWPGASWVVNNVPLPVTVVAEVLAVIVPVRAIVKSAPTCSIVGA